ncbi:MAG: radical SAM protein, partial [Caldithrix sp.]|nr:radical SAM protein [Caldithrix sp.]
MTRISPVKSMIDQETMLLMKGIVFDLKKYAIHDGPGIRTTVFLKGCPLDCWWCHNPESRASQPESQGDFRQRRAVDLLYTEEGLIGKELTVAQVLSEVQKDQVFYEESGGGVTFSGGEPLIQAKFLKALLEAHQKAGLHTAVDTSGYAPYETFAGINANVDLYLYDLKLMDDTLHQKYIGVSNRLILQNLKKLIAAGQPVR